MDEQYVAGLYGPLIIASANSSALTSPALYQQDWVWQVQDFYNEDPLTVLLPWFLSPLSGGQEPQPDVPMVNGAFSGTSHLYVSGGDWALIRLINSGSLCMYTFSIDGATLEVIELDGTEVQPYPLSSVMLNVAQRAVVRVSFRDLLSRYPSLSAVYYRITMISDADLTADPFVPPYEPDFVEFTNWTGVIHIDSPSSTALPPYASWSDTMPQPPASTGMQMETNLLDARPVSYSGVVGAAVAVGQVPAATHELVLEVVFANRADGVNVAYVNNVSYDNMVMTATSAEPTTMSQSMMPMLYAAYLNDSLSASSSPSSPPALSSPTSGSSSGVIIGDGHGNYVVPYGAVVDVTILNTDTGEHPFHLHGNAFWVLSTSDYLGAEFAYAGAWLMRDTVSVPALGWVRIRFQANNPGVWMLHCHIDWHMAAGLAVVLQVALQRLTPSFMPLSPNSLAQCDTAIQQQIVAGQQAYAEAMASVSTTPSSSSGLSSGSKVAVGVAVGLGLPLLLLLLAVAYRCASRRALVSSKAPHRKMRDGDAESVSHVAPTKLAVGSKDSHLGRATEASSIELGQVSSQELPM